MKDKRKYYRKEPTWGRVAEGAKFFGWYPEEITDKKVIVEKGRQKLVAVRIPKTNKWKVLYFSGRVMDDITGIEDSRWAKGLLLEMAMLK